MPEPNFRNRTLFHGDNLKFLQAIDSGTIHLIATDPPFNKSRDFHATPDSLAAGGKFEDRWRWEEDVHAEWIDAIKDDKPAVWEVIDTANTIWKKKGKQKEDGSDMGAFLCYMGVRLMEMHRVLREDGSLYLHCDTTASHYLKAILDAIFGKKNFRNEVVWKRYGSHNDATAKYGRVHDNILYYAKSDSAIWTNEAREEYDEEYIARSYRNEDERGKYTTAPLHGRTLSGGGYKFEWKGITDLWRFPRARLDEMNERGLIHWPKRGKIPRRKVYLDRARGIPARDVITDIKIVSRSEDYGYRTQKPLALYERIIRASSNEGDIVLDPFAGCATTVVAAERLNRQWIGMDIWNGAHKAVVQRLITVGRLSPSGVPDDMLADITSPDSQERLITFGELHYTTTPPERTDDREIAVPAFELPPRLQPAPWERLMHAAMVEILADAQRGGSAGDVVCAGCGRTLPAFYMELDHIRPRKDGGANTIDNRVLLCGPCNNRKKANLTLSGLWAALRKNGRVVSPVAARDAFERAQRRAERVKREMA